MSKSDRIAAFVDHLQLGPDSSLDPCYLGFFRCFNEQLYYEAHDVLEHLWLQQRDDNHLFFKGLIQLAGAYVHLQKQYLRPNHPKDGRRLHPAVRLFELSLRNLQSYGPRHMGLDLEALGKSSRGMVAAIVNSEFRINPWSPTQSPRLELKIEG